MIDYSKFTEHPRCLECGEKLCSDECWRKYKKGNRNIGVDGCTLKPKMVNDKPYNRVRCNNCFEKKFGRKPKKLNIVGYDMEYLLDVPKEELVKASQDKAVTIENMIKRYGEEEGKRKFEEYCNKQAYTNSKEYYAKKGYTEEEYKEYNLSRAITLENMIKKHGEKEGTKKYNDYCEKQSYTNRPKYYVNNYGEEDGLKKYHNFITTKKQFHSRIGSDHFKIISDILSSEYNIDHKDIYFIDNDNGGSEYYIYDININRAWYYDFVITGDINICIEHHGNDHFTNDKIKKDNVRQKLIEDKGFKYFVLWEYKATENHILELCEEIRTYINEKRKNIRN